MKKRVYFLIAVGAIVTVATAPAMRDSLITTWRAFTTTERKIKVCRGSEVFTIKNLDKPFFDNYSTIIIEGHNIEKPVELTYKLRPPQDGIYTTYSDVVIDTRNGNVYISDRNKTDSEFNKWSDNVKFYHDGDSCFINSEYMIRIDTYFDKGFVPIARAADSWDLTGFVF